jgi:hypothetical protein
LAKPDYKGCAVLRVHPATPAILVPLVPLAASELRVREAPPVILAQPVPLAQLVVLVPGDKEAIVAILALRAPPAQRAPLDNKGLAAQSV